MLHNTIRLLLVSFALGLFLMGCTPSPGQLKKVLSENPDIITEAIEKNPLKFAMAFQKAHRDAQTQMAQQAEQEEKTRRDSEFKNPKQPVIEEGRAILGDPKAPITIVAYSDFQCPYCKKGAENVAQVIDKYGVKVRFIFKHLPLDFHPFAMPAAKRFEAIAMQDSKKAYKFHDEVFKNQDKMKEGEKFLDRVAGQVGANVAKMKKDMELPKISERIQKDMEEARKFEISGTPGFLVAGITIRGAYPPPAFYEIIDKKLKEQGL